MSLIQTLVAAFLVVAGYTCQNVTVVYWCVGPRVPERASALALARRRSLAAAPRRAAPPSSPPLTAAVRGCRWQPLIDAHGRR